MSLEVVIIGAVAAGPKAGCRLKRLIPEAKVTLVDMDSVISYGGCGIPYYVGGDVAELEGLRTTSFHMVRDEEFFRGAKGIEVLAGWRAEEIDREAKEVRLVKVGSDEEKRVRYDKLVLATGSRPFVPDLPGADLEGVLPVADLHQAEFIKNAVSQGRVERAAVLGTGPTGLEMAEALADLWGVEVDVFELEEQILPGLLDPDLARMAQNHLEEQEGVQLFLGTRVEGFGGDGEGRLKAVRFGGQERPVDLAVLATGVRPRDELARAAGLEVAEQGGIVVNEFLQTSDPDIFAAGDCLAQCRLIGGGDGQPGLGLGGQPPGPGGGDQPGRGAPGQVQGGLRKLDHEALRADHGQGRADPFPGRGGRVRRRGRTGGPGRQGPLLPRARADVPEAHRGPKDPPSPGYPGGGARGRGPGRADQRRGRAAAQGAVLEDISNLELAYAPPYAAAMDILNATANTLENILEGRLESLSPREFAARLHDPGDDSVFLDVRAEANARPYLEALADRGWRHLPQETLAQRLDELPRDRPLVLICNSGARSYEAQITLKAAGFEQGLQLGFEAFADLQDFGRKRGRCID